MARIYIETTIASFYYEVRLEPEMVARRNWTRRWFDIAKSGNDELVTSLAVEAELEAGDFPGKEDALALVADIPLVDLNDSVAEAVDAYIFHKLMPNDPTGDALHLAAASFHRCDFLVTWNCRHIANANKFGHIRRVNGILGLGNPALVTPWSFFLRILSMDSYSEVRRVRSAMSQAAGHDVRALIALINQRRPQSAARIIDPGTEAEQCDASKRSTTRFASEKSTPAAR